MATSKEFNTIQLLNSWISGALPEGVSGEFDKDDNPIMSVMSPALDTALAILAKEWYPSRTTDAVTSSHVATMYKQFSSWAKQGKGPALSRARRANILKMINTIRLAIDKMYGAAIEEDESGHQLQYALDASALADALLRYLKMAENPDSYFPKQELTFSVMAWASGVKSEASQLKNLWQSLANGPSSFSIQIARSLWDSQAEVMSFLGPEFSELEEARSLMNDALGKWEAIRSEMFAHLADDVVERYKILSAATVVLPKSSAYSLFSSIATSVATQLNHGWAWKSEDDDRKRRKPSDLQKLMLLNKRKDTRRMAVEAQSIGNAAVLAVRSAIIASSKFDDPGQVAPIVQTELSDLELPEVDSLRDIRYLGFDRPPTFSARLEKYSTAQADTAQPVLTDRTLAFKLSYPRVFRVEKAAKVGSVMMWSKGDLPDVMGSALAKPWGEQNIPSIYTRTRNRSEEEYTMKNYLRDKDGVVSGVPYWDYLKEAAELMCFSGTEKSALRKAIVNYLAPVMFVYTKGETSSFWSWEQPDLSTIYGVGTSDFHTRQTADYKETETAPFGGIRNEKLLQLVYETAIDDKQFRFVLHSSYPAPVRMFMLVDQLDSGIVVPTLVQKDSLDSTLRDTDRVSSALKESNRELIDTIISTRGQDSGKIGWQKPVGWSPFKLWMPGTFVSTFTPDSDLATQTALLTASCISVKWKKDTISGDLFLRGFVDNPVAVYDYGDIDKALSEEDPTPSQVTNHQVPRTDPHAELQPGTAGGPAAANVTPQSGEQKAADGLEQLQQVALVQTKGADGDTIEIQSPDSGHTHPLTGSPISGAKPTLEDPSGEDVVWIVIEEDGKKVLKKVPKSGVPSGAVLASEVQIKAFLEGKDVPAE